MSEVCEGRIGRASRNAPSPRTAWYRTPETWWTTSAARAPASSSTQRLVEYRGMPSAALVEPSTGSTTTTREESGPLRPDSSDRTPRPSPWSTARTASSATTSKAYWPGRPPGRRRSEGPIVSSAAWTARAPSARTARRSAGVRGAPLTGGETTGAAGSGALSRGPAAAIDVAGYVADLKDHSVDHGFHVHDERHFVETYSLRQVWEVDLHPEEGCGGPVDLHLALDVDPRVLLSFEDVVLGLADDEEPPDEYHFPLTFTWALPPLPKGPDLLRLAIDLAGIGGIELPLEVSAIDSFASATDGPERRLSVVARHPVSLAKVLAGEELLCDVFDRSLNVSRFLLEAAAGWLG